MLKSAKRWVLATVSLLLMSLLACAGITYIVDPFELYRESAILPLYDQESYNNPGIAKSYDYDAVILGTSMVEMSNPSVIDECFGVQSVKLPMRGSHTAQMGWQLDHIFHFKEKRGEALKLAILAVDAYSLMGPVDDMEEIYDYLWNDDVLDDVNYLLNRDVLMVRIPRMLKNIGKDTSTKRDDMYKWVDVVFAAKSVYDTTGKNAQKPMQDADSRIERSTANIENHLVKHIAAHPETKFLVYMPPYSVAYWYLMTREGISEQQYRSRARVCEFLLEYDNVEIYDFSSRVDWITDLDEYFDYSHHSSGVSDRIMREMAAGEGRVYTTQDMWDGSERIRRAVIDFAAEFEK